MSARNILRLWTEALVSSDRVDLASGEALSVLPSVDDQGALNVGNGTYDMDVKVFLGSTSEYVEFNVGDSKLNVTVPIATSGGGYVSEPVTQKNAATIVVNSTHYGGLLVATKADGATTVQLPTPATSLSGAWLEVTQQANQNLVVNCATANKIVSLNSITYNTVTFSTANEKIGAFAKAICDGTKWRVAVVHGTGTLA
jgi:hypothetical protein